MQDFITANPDIELLTPASPAWAQRRATRGQAGQEQRPIGIAVPKNARDVAVIVRWAAEANVDFTVRSGGNDFYGRNVVVDGLVIDMQSIDFIQVANDKETVTLGGGASTRDLIRVFEQEGVLAPCGNSWVVGYVGWATLGGYGPMTNLLGMGFEGIVGARVVNARGEVVEADGEMLEGIRGMGGQLGIITSLTIRVYPMSKILSGSIVLKANPESFRAIIHAEEEVDLPKSLTISHTTLKQEAARVFLLNFTWTDPDHERGRRLLEKLIATLPPLEANTPVLPWGAQRSIYLGAMDRSMVEALSEALEDMPGSVDMNWTMPVKASSDIPSTFGVVRSHVLVCLSYMVPKEDMLGPARRWIDDFFRRMRTSGQAALLDGSYPPMTRPRDRSPEQTLGAMYERAVYLKAKFDPDNVFRHAVPSL